MNIVQVKRIESYQSQLNNLLCDCVNEGASIGFISPLSVKEADNYWKDVGEEVLKKSKILYVVQENEKIIGTAQLSLCLKKNGLHRAEVEKVMVHPCARGKGVAKALMYMIESKSKDLGRSLLVLDTRKGDVASSLYQSVGYQFAGEIPDYASNSDGGYDATIYYYKKI